MSHRNPIGLLAALLLAPLYSVPSAEPPENDYARWEKDIAAFESSDAVHPPPKGALLFVGSSTVRMWSTLAQDFPRRQIVNRGFGGSQIEDATRFAPRIIFPCAPRAIYLRAGGNDLWAGKSVEQVFADFKEFVATIHAKLPETDIVFISLSPSIARWKQANETKALNMLVSDFVKGKARLRYIETYDSTLGPDGQIRPELFLKDGLHFNTEGYKVLAALVRADLPESAPSNAAPSKKRSDSE